MKFYSVIFMMLATTSTVFAQSPSANSSPKDWPNATVSGDGTIWSDILDHPYANCISKKDKLGNPIKHPDDDGGFSVECESEHLVYLGAKDYSVIDSDAVRACSAIGGMLPNWDDVEILKAYRIELPHSETSFPTSVIPSPHSELRYGHDPIQNEGFPNGQYICGPSVCNALAEVGYDRAGMFRVRCVNKHGKYNY